MEKIAIWNNYPGFEKNRMFDPSVYSVTPELGFPVIRLREVLNANGYELETADMSPLSSYGKVIFLDYPTNFPFDIDEIPIANRVLICVECELIHRLNHITRRRDRSRFGTILTYNDELVQRFGYTKCALPNKLRVPARMPWETKKLITLMAGNKKQFKPGELYSARSKVIDYLESAHPADFDFYGPKWDTVAIGSRVMRKFLSLARIPAINAHKRHACWKGIVDNKIATLSRYKFCICYENASNIKGYISEKIFDCFFAGCVPVYLGAPNVLQYIPRNAFIDRREFPNDRALYDYLASMSLQEYNGYLEGAEAFLGSERAELFGADKFADTVLSVLRA